MLGRSGGGGIASVSSSDSGSNPLSHKQGNSLALKRAVGTRLCVEVTASSSISSFALHSQKVWVEVSGPFRHLGQIGENWVLISWIRWAGQQAAHITVSKAAWMQ